MKTNHIIENHTMDTSDVLEQLKQLQEKKVAETTLKEPDIAYQLENKEEKQEEKR